MNTLIIYDSEFGNTEQIARKIAGILEARGLMQLVTVGNVGTLDVKGVDLLVVGCPTQVHGLTPAMRELLNNIPDGALNGLPTTAFDTRYHVSRLLSGSAATEIARKLHKAGASLLLHPESFFIDSKKGPLLDGELLRAERWARSIIEKFESASSMATGDKLL